MQVAWTEDSLPSSAVTALIPRVSDTAADVASLATSALCFVIPFPDEAAQAVCARLRVEHGDVRRNTLRSIKSGRVDSVEVLGVVAEYLLNPSPDIQYEAIQIIRRKAGILPGCVLERLVSLLQSPKKAENFAAVRCLSGLPSDGFWPVHTTRSLWDQAPPQVLDTLTELL